MLAVDVEHLLKLMEVDTKIDSHVMLIVVLCENLVKALLQPFFPKGGSMVVLKS